MPQPQETKAKSVSFVLPSKICAENRRISLAHHLSRQRYTGQARPHGLVSRLRIAARLAAGSHGNTETREHEQSHSSSTVYISQTRLKARCEGERHFRHTARGAGTRTSASRIAVFYRRGVYYDALFVECHNKCCSHAR